MYTTQAANSKELHGSVSCVPSDGTDLGADVPKQIRLTQIIY